MPVDAETVAGTDVCKLKFCCLFSKLDLLASSNRDGGGGGDGGGPLASGVAEAVLSRAAQGRRNVGGSKDGRFSRYLVSLRDSIVGWLREVVWRCCSICPLCFAPGH